MDKSQLIGNDYSPISRAPVLRSATRTDMIVQLDTQDTRYFFLNYLGRVPTLLVITLPKQFPSCPGR